jgi:RNA-directed DNA polymerase
VLLDEGDRELERRGHKFVRYADDCNVYVSSQRAGHRVLRALRECYAKLRLRINEAKTAVARVWGAQVPGLPLLGVQGQRQVCGGQARAGQVAPASAVDDAPHARVQPRTDCRGPQGLVPGWKAYFRLAQTRGVLRRLDEGLRHRLRAIQLKQWRRGTTVFRELRRLGAGVPLATLIAGNARRWWRTSALGLNKVLTIAFFDRLGVPRFS